MGFKTKDLSCEINQDCYKNNGFYDTCCKYKDCTKENKCYRNGICPEDYTQIDDTKVRASECNQN